MYFYIRHCRYVRWQQGYSQTLRILKLQTTSSSRYCWPQTNNCWCKQEGNCVHKAAGFLYWKDSSDFSLSFIRKEPLFIDRFPRAPTGAAFPWHCPTLGLSSQKCSGSTSTTAGIPGWGFTAHVTHSGPSDLNTVVTTSTVKIRASNCTQEKKNLKSSCPIIWDDGREAPK